KNAVTNASNMDRIFANDAYDFAHYGKCWRANFGTHDYSCDVGHDRDFSAAGDSWLEIEDRVCRMEPCRICGHIDLYCDNVLYAWGGPRWHSGVRRPRSFADGIDQSAAATAVTIALRWVSAHAAQRL